MNKNNLIIVFLVAIIVVLGYMLFKGGGASQGAAVNKYNSTPNYKASIEYIKTTLKEGGAEVPKTFYPGGTFDDAANFAKTVGIPVYNSVSEALESQNNSDPVSREVACDWIMDGQIIASSGNAPYNTGVTNLGGGLWRHCYWAGSI